MNKKCLKCQVTQNVINFHRCKSRKDGLDIYCKQCSKHKNAKYYHNNKEHVLESTRLYYSNNKKTKLEKNKQWQLKNKEYIKNYSKEYYKQRPYVPKRKNYRDIFINKAAITHNHKYDYSMVEYINYETKVDIICIDHGIFQQSPRTHLFHKSGCNKCAVDKSKITNTKTTEQFVKEAEIIHDYKYDYSLVEYVNANTLITIICPIHGTFKQLPYVHTSFKCGCKKCIEVSHSKIAIKWLTELSKSQQLFIQHAGNIGEFCIPDTNFKADGYCKETNTIYEFYGDVFHGNLKVFKANDTCHPFNKTKTAEQLYNKTKEREDKLQQMGYKLITIWESDYTLSKKNSC